MSRFRCQYRGSWFDSDTADTTADRCIQAFTPGEDVEQPKPARIPGALDPYRNADVPGTEWEAPPGPVVVTPPNQPPTFLDRLADVMDAIPRAPFARPVPRNECAFCRVGKKLLPWLGLVAAGLVVAYLSKRLIR